MLQQKLVTQEKQLKKEERVALFEKLRCVWLSIRYVIIFIKCNSQSQAKLPTTLHLQSSSTLGTGKASTHRDRLEKLEDKEARRAIEGRPGKRKRGGDIYDILRADNDGDDDTDIGMSEQERINPHPTVNAQQLSEFEIVDSSTTSSTTQPIASTSSPIGSALRRNPDGTIVSPQIKKRTNGKKVNIILL